MMGYNLDEAIHRLSIKEERLQKEQNAMIKQLYKLNIQIADVQSDLEDLQEEAKNANGGPESE